MFKTSERRTISLLLWIFIITVIIACSSMVLLKADTAYADEETPAMTPVVTVATDDTSGSKITSLDFVENALDGSYSEWKLTANPKNRWYLSYIRNTETGEQIESNDGVTVTWQETVDNASYEAVFQQVTVKVVGWKHIFTELNAIGLSKCQEFCFYPEIELDGPLKTGNVVYISVYAGKGTNNTLLTKVKYNVSSDFAAGRHYLEGDEGVLFIRSVPSDSKAITIETKIEKGTAVSNILEFDDLKESESVDLEYMDIPGGSCGQDIGGIAGTNDNGPSILDAVSFVDENTGNIRTYFATGGGITIADGNDYTEVKLDNKYQAVFAIGGRSEDELYALAIKNHGENANYGVMIYKKNGSGFDYIDDTYIDHNYTDYGKSLTGLIMDGDDIWIDKIHYDGDKWVSNDVIFTSFYKVNNELAYAGAEDGMYKYENGVWTKLNGFSDQNEIIGGIAQGNTIKLLVAKGYYTNLRHMGGFDIANYSNSFTVVSITGSSLKTEPIDLSMFRWSGGNANYSNLKGALLDYEGKLYLVKRARSVTPVFMGNGFNTSELYRYDNDDLIFQDVESFFVDRDVKYLVDGDYDYKVRPNGVSYGITTLPNVTYFVGYSGSVYVKYGDTTITFNSDGGNDIDPITQKIGTNVKQPKKPVKNGALFGGWYTEPDGQGKRYSFDTMPATDMTLYARWLTEDDPQYEQYISDLRNSKLEVLEGAYGRLNEDSYTEEDWERITEIYAEGRTNIENAKTEDEIIEALNDAVDAMLRIEPVQTGEAKVCLTMELFTLQEGYIIKPTIITTEQYTPVSVLITEQLKKEFPEIDQPWTMTGEVRRDFYLASAYSNQLGWIGEKDQGPDSGWMYAVNSEFPGIGASGYSINDGDVVRWQYTKEGLGADLGTSAEWAGDNVATVAEKDGLTWLVAEINGKIDSDADYLSRYGLTEPYNDAMDALTTMYSKQEEVDAAQDSLQTAYSAALLSEAKVDSKSELEGYKDPSDYREAEQEQLASLVAAGKDAIDEAESIAGVKAALAEYKELIDALKTDAELQEEEEAAARALSEARNNAKAALEGYKSASDYREAEQEQLASLIAAGKEAIDEAASIDAVNAVLDEYKGLIDALKTAAEYEAEEAAEAARQLAEAKGTAKTELEGYKPVSDYREAEQEQLASLVAAGKEAVDEAASIDAVNAVLDEYKEQIDALKTAAEYEAEEAAEAARQLAEAKGTAKTALEGYKSASDYREAEQEQLASLITAGKDAIDKAASVGAVNAALDEYKGLIDALKTAAQYETEEAAQRLADAKNNAKIELMLYRLAEEYREEDREEFQTKLQAWKDAIDKAETTDDVTATLIAAKNDIDLIKTIAQYEAEEEKAKSDAVEDAKKLREELSKYEKKASSYTPGSYTVFRNALDRLNALLKSSTATSTEINTAIEELKTAAEGLKKKNRQKLTIKGNRLRKFKAAKLAKKKAVFRAFTVKGSKGKVTYKVSGNRKSKKTLKFNKKTRKITVRKGTKKGLYKLTIRVKASGNARFLPASRRVIVKVRVR